MYPKNVIYKSRKVKDRYCTICEQFLSGSGSLVSPYKCECGTYAYDYETNVMRLGESDTNTIFNGRGE